jgi:hypothetical protein
MTLFKYGWDGRDMWLKSCFACFYLLDPMLLA